MDFKFRSPWLIDSDKSNKYVERKIREDKKCAYSFIHSFIDVPVSSQYKISTMPKNEYNVKVDTKAR